MLLKGLVGAASIAILAFVGFYFYQTYAAAEAAKAAEAERVAALVEAIVSEGCASGPAQLASEVSKPFPDSRVVADLNSQLLRCLEDGRLEQRDLLAVPAADLALPFGDVAPATSGECLTQVRNWVAGHAGMPPRDRGAVELKVRRCVVNKLLDASTVQALAGDGLNPMLGRAGLT